MISLEIRYFNQASSHVSMCPQRSWLKIRTDKRYSGFFSPSSKNLRFDSLSRSESSFKSDVFQTCSAREKHTPNSHDDDISKWDLTWDYGTQEAQLPQLTHPMSGRTPGYYRDTAGMTLIWIHLPTRTTHLQTAMERETHTSKGRIICLDTRWFPPALSSTYLFLQGYLLLWLAEARETCVEK